MGSLNYIYDMVVDALGSQVATVFYSMLVGAELTIVMHRYYRLVPETGINWHILASSFVPTRLPQQFYLFVLVVVSVRTIGTLTWAAATFLIASLMALFITTLDIYEERLIQERLRPPSGVTNDKSRN